MNILSTLLLAISVTVSNPIDTPRDNAAVVVAVPADAANAKSVIFKDASAISYQLDDLNDDGKVDELVFMVDLKGKEKKTFDIEFSAEPQAESIKARTSAYIKLNDKNKKYPKIVGVTFPGDADNKVMYNSIYGHGAVLEGLYNAIRVYMDNRQSVDLYAKNTPRLELSETGFYTTREQLEKGFGRDVLWAGTSVALGSFRGYQGGEPVTIDTVDTRGQRVVVSGPVRSIIEVVDKGWVYNGTPVDMRQRYTMYAGHRDYDVEISICDAKSDELYCTGVQKLAIDNEGFIETDGLAGSWGTNVPDKNMSDIEDTIGLGIYVGAPYLHGVKEDKDNYLTILQTDKDGKICYSFVAGAVRDSDSPHAAAEWFKWLKEWKKQKANPMEVTVK